MGEFLLPVKELGSPFPEEERGLEQFFLFEAVERKKGDCELFG